MSKRGSPYLRHAIFLAATTCSFHNSPLNAYYKKKREQGKHHLTATGAVARKLTTVIYAVLRDGKPYEPKKFLLMSGSKTRIYACLWGGLVVMLIFVSILYSRFPAKHSKKYIHSSLLTSSSPLA